jgi:hypothetical protein
MPLMSATVDNSSGNVIYPSLPSEADSEGRLSPLRHDAYSVSPGTGSAGPGSGPSGPLNGLPSHIDRYPGFLNTMFDPDGAGVAPPLAPLARYSGSQIVLSTQALMVQVVVFAPGALAAFPIPSALSDLGDPKLGYASFTVIDDPTAIAAPGDAITDRCASENRVAMLYGETRANPCAGITAPPCDTDGGVNNPTAGANTGRIRYMNPPSMGTHFWYGFHQSARDLDGDGFENALDTCPYAVNTDASPKTSAGADGDMLDSACDPAPGAANADQDGDGMPNAADNCPLAANPTQAEAENLEPFNIASPRGGTVMDGLGDACDLAEGPCGAAADDDADGLVNDGCPTVGGAVAETVCTYSPASEADNDADGWPNDGCPLGGATAETGNQCDNLKNDDPSDDALVNDGCPVQGGPEYGCLNNTDKDGDGAINDGCPSSSRVASGHFHTTLSLLPECIGGVDVDADGYCSVNTPVGCSPNTPATLCTVPADPLDSNANIIPETFSQVRAFPVAHSGSGNTPPSSREPLQTCNDGVDNDADAAIDIDDDSSFQSPNVVDDCRPPDTVFTGSTPDTDGDGSKDVVEIHVGTDALSRCQEGLLPNAVTSSTAWPMDHRGESTFSGDKANIRDMGSYTSPVRRLNTKPGDAAFDRRFDLRPGNNASSAWITVADMSIISTQLPLPMLGVRAFGITSVCSSHKVYGD